MRVRKKKNLQSRMGLVTDQLVTEPRANKGHWQEISGGRQVWLEIGCGKGRFAIGTAIANPDIFFLAVEIEPNVLILALEAAKEQNIENLRFMRADAANLDAYFAQGEISRIFLNFSDPWPHNKTRRLTAPAFLSSYRRVLAENGDIRLKTDNSDLFEWSVETMTGEGWHIDDITRDLHAGELDGGVITEYEERFMGMDTPINYMSSRPPEGKLSEKVELLHVETKEDAAEVARLAERIWREHFTPLIGKAQVAYMLEKFQSAEAIYAQIEQGYIYRILSVDGVHAGYIGVHPEKDRLFLSKLYIEHRFRGRGYARVMLEEAKRIADGLDAIYLTCNKYNSGSLAAYRKMGFYQIDSVVSDIGNGFVMDDYIYQLDLK